MNQAYYYYSEFIEERSIGAYTQHCPMHKESLIVIIYTYTRSSYDLCTNSERTISNHLRIIWNQKALKSLPVIPAYDKNTKPKTIESGNLEDLPRRRRPQLLLWPYYFYKFIFYFIFKSKKLPQQYVNSVIKDNTV